MNDGSEVRTEKEKKHPTKKQLGYILVIMLIVVPTVAIIDVILTYKPQKPVTTDSTPTEPTKQTFKVEVTSYGLHRGAIQVENSSGHIFYTKDFEGEDVGRVETTYEIQASVGDIVTVEVLSLGEYIRIALVKERLLLDKTLISTFESERAILRYTIREGD